MDVGTLEVAELEALLEDDTQLCRFRSRYTDHKANPVKAQWEAIHPCGHSVPACNEHQVMFSLNQGGITCDKHDKPVTCVGLDMKFRLL